MYPNYYKSSQKVSVKAVAIRSYKAGIDIQKMLNNARSAVDFQAIGEGFSGAAVEIRNWINKHGEGLGRAAFGDLKEKLAELNVAIDEYADLALEMFQFDDTTPVYQQLENMTDQLEKNTDLHNKASLVRKKLREYSFLLVKKGAIIAVLISGILGVVVLVYRTLSKLGPNITKAINNGEYFIDQISKLASLYESEPNKRGIQQEVIILTKAANVYARVEIRKLLKPMKDVFPDDYNRIMNVADQIDEVTLGFREDIPEQTKPALKNTIELIRRLVDELAAFQDKTSELERDDLSKKVEKRLR